MYSKDLTLLIGAGASKDIHPGFGLGKDLLISILNHLREGSNLYVNLLNDFNITSSTINRFCEDLNRYILEKKEGFGSIDEFLFEVECFPEYRNFKEEYSCIGRAAIIITILEWESSAAHAQINFYNNWTSYIFDFIKEKRLLDFYKDGLIADSSLQIVTFNYDRLIEYALLKYGEETGNIDSIKLWIENNIFHVYGSIGEISSVPFGSDLKNKSFPLKQLIYREDFMSTYNHRNTYKIKHSLKSNNKYISNATAGDILLNSNKTLVFGFGFDYYNCRYLSLHNPHSRPMISNLYIPRQIDTGFEKRRSEVDRVKRIIVNTDFRFGSCSDLLTEEFNS